MGRDKAFLEYAGECQLVRAHRMLSRTCSSVLVSVRSDQLAEPAFAGFELVADDVRDGGPAAGIFAAWRKFPNAVLLVLAVDLPLVDDSLLARLIASRDPDCMATAFETPDGGIEPLCTIWEPSAQSRLRAASREGQPSPRRLLESSRVRRLVPSDARVLESVNTAAAYAAARQLIES